MKKPWVLSYPLSAQRRLWSDTGWSESSLGAHPFCCFCHVVAQIIIEASMMTGHQGRDRTLLWFYIVSSGLAWTDGTTMRQLVKEEDCSSSYIAAQHNISSLDGVDLHRLPYPRKIYGIIRKHTSHHRLRLYQFLIIAYLFTSHKLWQPKQMKRQRSGTHTIEFHILLQTPNGKGTHAQPRRQKMKTARAESQGAALSQHMAPRLS